jgi:peptide/nickel transport system substrate-binding protein
MRDRKEFEGLSRREFLQLCGMGIAGVGLAGIPELAHGQEKKPKYGGRLRVAYPFGSRGLDAHKNQEFMDYQNYGLMYGALTEQGPVPQVEISPMLAKSWEISRDEREYTFSLREGVKFHHGKELDSGDVQYSIERLLNPATRAPRAFALRLVDSIQTIDKYHLKIRLKETFAPFLNMLTLNNCAIIPAGWEPTGMKPAPGTGPFKFKSFVPNETTEYTRFDQYYEVDEKTGNHLPYVDAIYVQKIVDDTVRFAGLRAGDVDCASGPPFNTVAKVLTEKNPYRGSSWAKTMPGICSSPLT